MTTTVDEGFSEYLKGKSVAIVGRAGYLRDLEQGELIDSYDVVVRLHKAVPYLDGEAHPFWNWNERFVPIEMEGNLGRRVNVLYANFYNHTDIDWVTSMVKSFRNAGGTFIANELPYNAKEGFASPRIESLLDGMVHNFSEPEFDNLAARIGGVALVGTAAVEDIVSRDVKTAYITGFPCFLDMKTLPADVVEQQITKDTCVRNLQYIHSIVVERRFKADAVMKDLFYQYCRKDAIDVS